MDVRMIEALGAHVGVDAVRLAPDRERHPDASRPSCIVEPRDVEGVSATLAWASAHGVTVAPQGGGTKRGWGRPVTPVDVTLSTRRLSGVIDHASADLTATVRAGTPLVDVNRTLATGGQWIPIDPLGTPGASIGGVLACNDSGPRRHRYGGPRDVLIGVAFVTADGTVARSGGRVVKNVAGYDLGRLLTGSHGTLGVIVEATFKLSPLAAASRTVEVGPGEIGRLAPFAQAIADSQLVPSAIEMAWPPARVLVRFESVEPAVREQAEEVLALATTAGLDARVLDGTEEASAWRAHGDRVSPVARTIDAPEEVATFRLGVPAASLGAELMWLERALARPAVDGAFVGRAALGTGHLTLGGARDAIVGLVTEQQRRCEAVDGYMMMLSGSPALRAAVDPWGPLGDARRVMEAVKLRFDPQGTFGARPWTMG